MDAYATLDRRGRITIPKSARKALGLRPGDRVVFRVESNRVNVFRAPDFLELAGSVPIPPGARGLRWNDIRALTRRTRARSRY